ncbi:MAG: asparaginase [Gammaproteobacteria bacterium]
MTRGDCVEGIHYGSIAVTDQKGKVLFSVGDPDWQTFTRSSCKPLQAMPLLCHECFSELELAQDEIAIMCGSHSGEPDHVKTVKNILDKIGLDEGYLCCGVHPPLYLDEMDKLPVEGETFTALQHNCSGKHVGMLAQCKLLGVPADKYLALDSPVQQGILSGISAFTGLEKDQIGVGIDGCSAPNFSLPLKVLASVYAQLANPDEGSRFYGVCKLIYSAMTSHPFMVSGTQRLDLLLMQTGNGDWLSKMGAEAVQCIGIGSRGWGIAIKIIDGNTRAMKTVAVELLKQLHLLDDAKATLLGAHISSGINNHKGLKIGEIKPVFTLSY